MDLVRQPDGSIAVVTYRSGLQWQQSTTHDIIAAFIRMTPGGWIWDWDWWGEKIHDISVPHRYLILAALGLSHLSHYPGMED